MIRCALLLTGLAILPQAEAQQPDQVLVVVNTASPLSRSVAEYYARRRGVPQRNVCRIATRTDDEIEPAVYDSGIAKPIANFLKRNNLREKIVYIVLTPGVPLRVNGNGGMGGSLASVDSELTLLYAEMGGQPRRVDGYIPNPMFGRTDLPRFVRRDFPIYLVTRLAGYDFADIRALVDRSLAARDRGKVVLDLRDAGTLDGDDWLLRTAQRLPAARVVLEQTKRVLYDQTDVIGYAAWGSNDPNRKRRRLNFKWLPGAILDEYVSTNARTFERPPEDWAFGDWKNKLTWFGGSPQSLAGDYIHEGITGMTGHVAEPYLGLICRPEILFPAYLGRRTLAESFYLSMPGLSWRNIVIGDPLCVLKPD